MIEFEKRYLGDGVYVEVENGMLKLTTSDGISETNTVYLEMPVYNKLAEYVRYALALAEASKE